MAATTISRTAYDLLVNDSGSGLDGSIIDKADIDDTLDAVDAIFASTTGITLNQGAGDAGILTLESSDVAHGMTAIAGTSVYRVLLKASPTEGGLMFRCLTESVQAFVVEADSSIEDAVRTTSGVAPIQFATWTKSGTTSATPTANVNLAVFKAGAATRFILDTDGDSHQDVGTAWTNFDFLQDVDALTALSVALTRPDDPLRAAFGALLEQYRPVLEQHRIVTFNSDGHHFINWSRTNMLMIGAVRQQAQQLAALEARLAQPSGARRLWRRVRTWIAGREQRWLNS